MATVDPWTDEGGDNTEYFHTNHLGTTRFMSEPDGDPVDAAVYTAFGERVSGPNHRYGYAGAYGYQAHDFPESPDDPIPYLHVGARYYDPASGRFLERDPIGIDGGLNVYEYAFSCPSLHVDPDGEFAVTGIIIIGGLIVVSIVGVAEAPGPQDTYDDFRRHQEEEQRRNFMRARMIAMGCLGLGPRIARGIIGRAGGLRPPNPPSFTSPFPPMQTGPFYGGGQLWPPPG
jgi:RHS repeat-associated protein